jgi:wyosine [tRNA(Phe)-imidazoG37] synthetase (radical SAM superfamily)
VYCHLGCKKPQADIRQDMINPVVILRRTRQLFHTLKQEFDWVAISGSGEPTLNASLGWLILQVKELTGLPVAVITNGSLFCRISPGLAC